MYTPYNIFDYNLPNYQTAGETGKPDPGRFKPGDLVEVNGEKKVVTGWDPVNGKYITEVSDGKTNVAVDKGSVKKYTDQGINIDFGNVGETRYVDTQPAETTAGRFGDATKNEQGWKDTWKGAYPDYDNLVASLPKYGNKENPEVKKFQKWLNENYIPSSVKTINEQRVKAGYKPFTADETQKLENDLKTDYGFNPSKRGKAYDGLWGTFTSSRRPLNYNIDPLDKPTPPQPTIVQTPPQQTTQPIIPGKLGRKGTIPPKEWFSQDVMNFMNTLAVPPKKYLPWAPTVDLQEPEYTLLDPTWQLQNNAALMNQQLQGLGAFGNSQSYLANATSLAGKASEQSQNVLAEYDARNAMIQNQGEQAKTAVRNQENLANAERTKNLYDGTTIANQQYDNSRRQYLDRINKALVTGTTNAAMAYNTNFLNPYEYYIDPSSGGMILGNPQNYQDLIPSETDEVKIREGNLDRILIDPRYKNFSPEDKLKIFEDLYPTQTYPSGTYPSQRRSRRQPSIDDNYMRMMQQMMYGNQTYPNYNTFG
jgi:hypothetical protein